MERNSDRNRGFGFVEMLIEEEGLKAIEKLNGYKLGGREIIVDKVKRR